MHLQHNKFVEGLGCLFWPFGRWVMRQPCTQQLFVFVYVWSSCLSLPGANFDSNVLVKILIWFIGLSRRHEQSYLRTEKKKWHVFACGPFLEYSWYEVTKVIRSNSRLGRVLTWGPCLIYVLRKPVTLDDYCSKGEGWTSEVKAFDRFRKAKHCRPGHVEKVRSAILVYSKVTQYVCPKEYSLGTSMEEWKNPSHIHPKSQNRWRVRIFRTDTFSCRQTL